jgi:hypothetical protein
MTTVLYVQRDTKRIQDIAVPPLPPLPSTSRFLVSRPPQRQKRAGIIRSSSRSRGFHSRLLPPRRPHLEHSHESQCKVLIVSHLSRNCARVSALQKRRRREASPAATTTATQTSGRKTPSPHHVACSTPTGSSSSTTSTYTSSHNAVLSPHKTVLTSDTADDCPKNYWTGSSSQISVERCDSRVVTSSSIIRLGLIRGRLLFNQQITCDLFN